MTKRDVERWRNRAEELRAIATEYVSDARAILMRAAADYDNLADRIEGALTAFGDEPMEDA